ncbi:MAG TPA: FAD/NAD(P)-binding protein [Burkholderiaceae bacterium]|nr:FAD/NAD(P)-binding protein [Burkholderiaceae bacterium]
MNAAVLAQNEPFAVPAPATVVERIDDAQGIFTLQLQLDDPRQRAAYHFVPGQFNMLSLFGVGEVAISVVSDPQQPELISHTIRTLGRITRGLAQLNAGDAVGVRGPFGRGWPLADITGRNVLVVTGGLGCAPVVSVINYILMRRAQFGRLAIVQGVKHPQDLIWRERYAYWRTLPHTEVWLAADVGAPLWPGHIGRVTELFDRIDITPDMAVLLCGPEIMMVIAIRQLLARGVAPGSISLSMERNMQCGRGVCGHCQLGPHFLCRDGPVFAYPAIAEWLGRKGL